MFKTASRPVIGLDVGTTSVKMVGLRKNGDGYHVTGAAMSRMESVNGSDRPTQSAMTAAIKDCLESSGENISRNSHFVFGLSGPKVKVSSFNFPFMTPDELAQAIMFEAAQVCPFDIRTSVVDYQLIDTDKAAVPKKKKVNAPNLKGILAIAEKKEIARKQALAEEALLKCVLMDSDGLALLNCLEQYLTEDEEPPVAVINVGMSLTTVAILGTDGLPFIRDLRYCGNNVISHIAKNSGTSADQVEQELFDGKRPAGIEQACSALIHNINETLAYYSIHHGSAALNHVYACGGFSLFDNFVDILANSINSRVSVLDPFERMNCDEDIVNGDLIKNCGAAFAVAAGLAMRQV